MTQGDEGWYQCSASNLYGGETRDAYLEVLDPCRGVECGGPEMECVVDNTTLTGQCKCRDFCRVCIVGNLRISWVLGVKNFMYTFLVHNVHSLRVYSVYMLTWNV